jgi:DNA-binding MarR family transcriptional regulator
MTAVPPLTGQDINLAARATRLVLIAALDTMDMTFEDWIVINLLGTGQARDVATLSERLASGLGLDGRTFDQLLGNLVAMNVVERTDDAIALAIEGERRWRQGQAIVAELVATLYAGFSPDDLATARRVLVEVTARAQAQMGA